MDDHHTKLECDAGTTVMSFVGWGAGAINHSAIDWAFEEHAEWFGAALTFFSNVTKSICEIISFFITPTLPHLEMDAGHVECVGLDGTITECGEICFAQ